MCKFIHNVPILYIIYAYLEHEKLLYILAYCLGIHTYGNYNKDMSKTFRRLWGFVIREMCTGTTFLLFFFFSTN